MNVTATQTPVIRHVDSVELRGRPDGFIGVNPSGKFPATFLIFREEIDTDLDASGALCFTAFAFWHSAALAHSSAPAKCIDFAEGSSGTIALDVAPLDVLRRCDDDNDCATGHCESTGSSIGFCTASCTLQSACPATSRCTAKLGGSGVCVPACTTDEECVPPGIGPASTWRCDVSDGLCEPK